MRRSGALSSNSFSFPKLVSCFSADDRGRKKCVTWARDVLDPGKACDGSRLLPGGAPFGSTVSGETRAAHATPHINVASGEAEVALNHETLLKPKQVLTQGGFSVGQVFRGGGKVFEMVAGAISTRQRRKHMRWLDQLHHLQNPIEFVEFVEHLRTSRRWKWSTAQTALGEMLGAISRTEVYGAPCRLKLLVQSAIFRDYMKRVTKNVVCEPVNHPIPLTRVITRRVLCDLYYLRKQMLLCLLVLAWGTASRVACALKLQTSNVQVDSDGIRVRFVEGKGVFARRRPYTVHTHLGQWQGQVEQFVAARGRSKFLFPPCMRQRLANQLRQALRQQMPHAELRSIRRGALIQMAEAGTPANVLLHFSGHASEQMLMRYLGWGWHHGHMRGKGLRAANRLW